MLQQIQRLQQQMEEAQEKLAIETVSATAGGETYPVPGSVNVTPVTTPPETVAVPAATLPLPGGVVKVSG